MLIIKVRDDNISPTRGMFVQEDGRSSRIGEAKIFNTEGHPSQYPVRVYTIIPVGSNHHLSEVMRGPE